LDLAMPLVAQYWNGSSWITNTDDSCTTAVSLASSDPILTDGLLTSELCAWDSGLVGSSGLGCSVAGVSSVRFKKPPLAGDLNFQATGAGNTGSLDITATVPSYLQFNWRGAGNSNPTARATFGVYKGGNKVIYFRELY
jgi:MSHA biogenesis protein MshQ